MGCPGSQEVLSYAPSLVRGEAGGLRLVGGEEEPPECRGLFCCRVKIQGPLALLCI